MLYLILNTDGHKDNEILKLAEIAIKESVPYLQLRAKQTMPVALAHFLSQMCRNTHTKFIVNDYIDLALACQADGVHLGQMDQSISAARQLLGPTAIIGGTASSLEEAMTCERQGANYVGLGHIFPTTTKHKDYPPLGLELLAQVCHILSVPVIAIGGITTSNCHEIRDAGAAGAAVVSAVSRSHDPREAIRRLQHVLNTR